MVTICAESGLLATSSCPTTYTTKLSSDQKLGTCTIHGGDGSATPITPNDTQAAPEPSKPAREKRTYSKTSEVHRDGDYVDLTICVDSGQIANEYCPQTMPKRYLASEAPKKVCRMHHPPEE